MNEAPLQHWQISTDENDVVWCHLDQSGTRVNTLSAEVLREFDTVLQQLEQRAPTGVVILSDKANGFIAGADVNEFRDRVDEQETFTYIRYCQSLFDRLEALPCPTVALIHGFCMGGGTELALACRYRIADDATTSIGLPEVKLGIHPGYGGTVRSIRIAGVLAAMDMMLTGRPFNARAAYRQGLLDYIVPERALHNAARTIIQEKPAQRKSKLSHKLMQQRFVRPLIASQLRKKVAQKANKAHYPAPYALIELWEKYADSTEMMEQEAHSVARLMGTQTAQNLIHVFFLQAAMKETGKQVTFKANHVHVVGAGIMGGDIAAWCALKGLTVTLQDQSPERIAPAIKRAASLFKRKLKLPRLCTAAMDRLIPDPQGDGLASADIVIEAIFENLAAKQQLFTHVESVVREDTLLCTNTSSIPLQELSTCLQNPARLVGLHFFNPVDRMQLVEIIHAENTDTEVTNKASAFAVQIARLPLKVKSSPGFLVNRVLMPYLLEAAYMVQEGISPSLIDKAATKFGMPMGPVELADKVGLDICLSVAEILSQRLGGDIPDILNDLVSAGKLGLKTEQGFYQYKKGHVIHEKVNPSDDQYQLIQDRLLLRFLNESVACLREGVVDSEDMLDAGIIFGTGFAPFTGGPIHYLHTLELQSQKKRFQQFNEKYGDRFVMDDGWDILLG